MEHAHGLKLNVGNLFQAMQSFQVETVLNTKFELQETREVNQGS